MKQCIVVLSFFSCLLLGKISNAQDILPEFKLKQIAPGKVLISWHNTHQNCVKLLVQRSSDPKNFKTIVSAKKPGLSENSFIDTKSPKNKNTYYRIKYTLKNGNVYFSNTHSTLEKQISTNSTISKTNTIEKVSPYVFSNTNGYIQIAVSNSASFDYKIKFFDETGNELFQINKIDQDNLILDKTNFIHGGWFQFELYKNNILLEKNKVFLKGN